MSVEALLYVNWIFWAALGAGTVAVVGLTELAGGTTRGYRLLMAWLGVVLGALVVASDLALPGDVVLASTAELRRPLSIAFAAGCVAYLVALLARRPGGAMAVGTGAVGMAALVVLAAGGGTFSPPLFAVQLLLSSLALGAVNAAMLLGHWYLVTPKLSPAPLQRMMWLLVGSLGLQGILFAVALVSVPTDSLVGSLAWLAGLRLAVGIGLPLVAAWLAIVASRGASLQASTGLLYIGLALVMAGSIAGASLAYLTGVPV